MKSFSLLTITAMALSLLPLLLGGMTANGQDRRQPAAPPAANTNPPANTGATTPLPATYQAANRALIAETGKLNGNRALLKNGERVPPFALYDQSGEAVLVPSQWQGKSIVISFIFTRCKMPAMCPASTARMAALQRTLKEQGLADKVQLLSITFDPDYDSPAVLQQYAKLFGIELSNYALLTGSAEVINSLLRRFGVLTVAENGTINHTMATVLISPTGTLDLRQTGPNWTIEAFLEKIR